MLIDSLNDVLNSTQSYGDRGVCFLEWRRGGWVGWGIQGEAQGWGMNTLGESGENNGFFLLALLSSFIPDSSTKGYSQFIVTFTSATAGFPLPFSAVHR